ncbi:gamma-tubulin complex component 6 isoform X3 [Panulirus ornatus]|uniref:gamma-tubulin complex component 6 isoform X3 n=1 Tax=Panulirus ornatus TaxID=150431 RepID=UPI003A89C959
MVAIDDRNSRYGPPGFTSYARQSDHRQPSCSSSPWAWPIKWLLGLGKDLSVASDTMQILLHQRETSGNEDDSQNDASKRARPGDTVSVLQVHTTPAVDSTISLVNQLVAHYCQDFRDGIYFRNKRKEDDLQRRLKKKVYSILLSHRKDYEKENSTVKLTELEEVIWQTYVLRQHRRYDDGNSLDRCLHFLKEHGHLEAGSDVRNVLKFLVALKGCGGDTKKNASLAQITPRIVHIGKSQPCFLPSGPLQYGDTFLQSAEYRPYYMHFPPEIFCLPSSLIEESGSKKNASPFGIETLMDLSKAPPGTGISPLLLGKSQSESCDGALGALLQNHCGEMSPDAVLSIPELPSNAQGYSHFSHLPTTLPLPSPSAVGSDEGYASSRAACLQTPEEDIGDIWEAVLQGPPLTSRRTWETLDHIPLTKEKLYLTESGPESSHNVWMLYQELWGSLGGHYVPVLHVKSMKELCQDLLNLMIGVPSLSFPWSAESGTFFVKEGLCYPGVAPEHLHGSLMPFVECGTLVRRLETVSATPRFDTQQVLTQGSVFRAFSVAISNVLQVYRGMVFSLSGETHLSKLQQKAQPLVKKIRFVAHLCNVTPNCDKVKETSGPIFNTKATYIQEPDCSQHTSLIGGHQEMFRGLNLLGELLNQIIVTKDRACLLLLVSIFKNSCAPFFRYLEDWIYEGVCSDPGLEFMIDVDGASLLKRDRKYWTNGYTLRDQSHVPPFLRDVLQEAFICGKALNLLKLCSPKHHLVHSGGIKHPSLQLCISLEEQEQVHLLCEAYASHMEYLAVQNQVTAKQRAEQEREERQRLILLSSKKHAAIIRDLEKKMKDVRQYEIEYKKSQFQVLKEEMLKAEERKHEEKKREADLDHKIALEMEEREKKKQEEEEKFRAEMESYYRQKMSAAERSRALANWKVQRCLLGEARRKYILHTNWLSQQDDTETLKLKEAKHGEPGLSYSQQISSHSSSPKVSQKGNSDTNVPEKLSPNTGFTGANSNSCHEKFFDIKDSPNQEFSSVSDMSQSFMSTSSDFIETPHDENLPDFEADPKRSMSSEKSYAENKSSWPYTKSSIGSNLYERPNDVSALRNKPPLLSTRVEASVNKRRVLEEEYEMKTEKTEGAHGVVTKNTEGQTTAARIFGEMMSDQTGILSDENRSKVLRDDYAISQGVGETASAQDANANFPTIGIPVCSMSDKDDENGNVEGGCHPYLTDDINANLATENSNTLIGSVSASVSYKENDFKDTNANVETSKNNVSTAAKMDSVEKNDRNVGEDENNGNNIYQNMNEVISEFKERRAQAAAIKQKVLNEEFQATTANKNTINILRSTANAVKIKQKVLDMEYGISESLETAIGQYKNEVVYSRQVSSASTSSYKSCSLYERQTSGSTAYTTPDEEKPVLIDQEPVMSPAGPYSDMSPADDLLSAVKNSVVFKAKPYDVENLKLMSCEPLLDITGTALTGKPNIRQPSTKELPSVPTTNELSCAPIYFIRSIRMHLATQSRLVNSSLLSEVLVQEGLLDHFSALRALLLFHDAHFAHALTVNLFSKSDTASSPAALLIPVELNNILNRSVSDSCWSTSPLSENLSFAITNIPPAFTYAISIVDCLELRYRVQWPHTLILDDTTLASYSRVWTFLASLHQSIWAADDLFSHTSFLSRQQKEGHFSKSEQFHQVCLFRHEMHHFLLVVQAYVISQVHQISWSKFEQKLCEKVASLDDLYDLHSSLVNSILSRCFLTRNSAVVLKLVRDVFSLMLRFRKQFLSHSWQTNSESGIMEHPGFNALKSTYQEFQKHATFLHKLLVKVGQRIRMDSCRQDLLNRLDFNGYYSSEG